MSWEHAPQQAFFPARMPGPHKPRAQESESSGIRRGLLKFMKLYATSQLPGIPSGTGLARLHADMHRNGHMSSGPHNPCTSASTTIPHQAPKDPHPRRHAHDPHQDGARNGHTHLRAKPVGPGTLSCTCEQSRSTETQKLKTPLFLHI